MSITLLDTYIIAGFLPNGIPIKDIGPPESLKPTNVPDNVFAYGKFFDRFYGTSSPIVATFLAFQVYLFNPCCDPPLEGRLGHGFKGVIGNAINKLYWLKKALFFGFFAHWVHF